MKRLDVGNVGECSFTSWALPKCPWARHQPLTLLLGAVVWPCGSPFTHLLYIACVCVQPVWKKNFPIWDYNSYKKVKSFTRAPRPVLCKFTLNKSHLKVRFTQIKIEVTFIVQFHSPKRWTRSCSFDLLKSLCDLWTSGHFDSARQVVFFFFCFMF